MHNLSERRDSREVAELMRLRSSDTHDVLDLAASAATTSEISER